MNVQTTQSENGKLRYIVKLSNPNHRICYEKSTN